MPNMEAIGSKMSTAVELDWFGPRLGNTRFFGDLHSGLMEHEGQWSTSTQVSET